MATYEVFIGRAAAEVFEVVGEPARDPEWNPNARTVIKLSDGDTGRGTRYEGTYRGFGRCDLEIVEFTPERRIKVRAGNRQGVFEYSFALEPVDSGTRLYEEASFSPRGIMRLAAPLMGLMLASRVRGVGDAAKRYLEATAR